MALGLMHLCQSLYLVHTQVYMCLYFYLFSILQKQPIKSIFYVKSGVHEGNHIPSLCKLVSCAPKQHNLILIYSV